MLSGTGGEKIRSRVLEKSEPEPSQRVICRQAALSLANRGLAPLACPVLPDILSTVADPTLKHLLLEERLQ